MVEHRDSRARVVAAGDGDLQLFEQQAKRSDLAPRDARDVMLQQHLELLQCLGTGGTERSEPLLPLGRAPSALHSYWRDGAAVVARVQRQNQILEVVDHMWNVSDARLERQRSAVLEVDPVKKRRSTALVTRGAEKTCVAVAGSGELVPVDVVVSGNDDDPGAIVR